MSERGYESADLTDDRRAVIVAVLGVCALVMAGFAAAWMAQAVLGGRPGEDVPDGAGGDVVRAQRQIVEIEWAGRGSAWGWREDAAGVATIPVERAAELLLARGFPRRAGVSRPLPARGSL